MIQAVEELKCGHTALSLRHYDSSEDYEGLVELDAMGKGQCRGGSITLQAGRLEMHGEC